MNTTGLAGRAVLSFAAMLTATGTPAAAQCGHWEPGMGVPGVRGEIYALTAWDPDGPGPEHELVVMGGYFDVAGDVAARNIAAWDPQTGAWRALGDGVRGLVASLAVGADGELLAGWNFNPGMGPGYGHVSAWTGAAWSPLGGELRSAGTVEVNSLAVTPGGEVIAGGRFTQAGDVPVSNIARWNGSEWSTLGSGVNSTVYSLALVGNDVVAGGRFASAGGQAAACIARWNGSAWTSVGPGIFGVGSTVYGIALTPDGGVVIGGAFALERAGPAVTLARLESGVWQPLVERAYGGIHTVISANSGLYIGGTFTSIGGGPVLNGIAFHDGESVHSLDGGLQSADIRAIVSLADGRVVAGGAFTKSGDRRMISVAVFDGAEWNAMSAGTDGAVTALATVRSGGLIAGGAFSQLEGVDAGRLAVHSGMWEGLHARVEAVAAVADVPGIGVVAGGLKRYDAGDIPNSAIFGWNGVEWTYFADSFTGYVRELIGLGDGEFVVGGDFDSIGDFSASSVARWTGERWDSLGSGTDGPVNAMARMEDGRIVAGGRFDFAGGVRAANIAVWDGVSWSALGEGIDPISRDSSVYAVAALPGGGIVVGGRFENASGGRGIAVWNGSSWSSLGAGVTDSGAVVCLAVLPNGDVFAGGTFGSIGGVPARGIARWRGSYWEGLAGGVNGTVEAIALTRPLEIAVGGSFGNADGRASAYLARWRWCDADFDCDDAVDIFDFDAFVSAFESGEHRADFNRDGFIDFFDFEAFVGAFEAGC